MKIKSLVSKKPIIVHLNKTDHRPIILNADNILDNRNNKSNTLKILKLDD